MSNIKKSIIINGGNFDDLASFYDEIDNVLTKDLDWKTGHNLNALNDLLRGGFGVYEYDEPVDLKWIHFSKSKNDLGEDWISKIIEIINDHPNICFSFSDD
jgi:RNAse (barnase) inhibitor barstar